MLNLLFPKELRNIIEEYMHCCLVVQCKYCDSKNQTQKPFLRGKYPFICFRCGRKGSFIYPIREKKEGSHKRKKKGPNMNINGVSNGSSVPSGWSYDLNAESTTLSSVKRLSPSYDNDTDIGSVSKRFKGVYCATINGSSVPASGYLPLSGGTMTGPIAMATQNITNASLVTPALGIPTSGTLTSCTGLPISTGVSGLAAGASTFLATATSANLQALMSDETGTGALVFANSPVMVAPALGIPASATLTNCTGLPVSTGISGLGANVATALGTFSSANILAAATTKTGTGNLTFASSPVLISPTLGAASATSITFSSTSGIIGSTTNDSASAGSVAELIESSVAGGSVSLTTTVTSNITSVSLTAGNWLVWGGFVTVGTGTATQIKCGLNTVSSTYAGEPNNGAAFVSNVNFTASNTNAGSCGMRRYALASTTTIYLVINMNFSATQTCGGYIGALRLR